MFATLMMSGSSAASTQTLRRLSALTMPSTTRPCSPLSFGLVSSFWARWSSTAGSELRRVEPASPTVETLRPAHLTSNSGLAPMNAASGVPTQKLKQEGKPSLIAANIAAGSWAEPARTTTSRASTTLAISPARIRSTAAATEDSNSPGLRTLSMLGRCAGCGSIIGSGESDSPATRASSLASIAELSAERSTITFKVMVVPAGSELKEISGRVIEAGSKDDHSEPVAPSSENAKPPTQVGPVVGASEARLTTSASPERWAHSAATSRKRSLPRETTDSTLPSAAMATPRSG